MKQWFLSIILVLCTIGLAFAGSPTQAAEQRQGYNLPPPAAHSVTLINFSNVSVPAISHEVIGLHISAPPSFTGYLTAPAILATPPPDVAMTLYDYYTRLGFQFCMIADSTSSPPATFQTCTFVMKTPERFIIRPAQEPEICFVDNLDHDTSPQNYPRLN